MRPFILAALGTLEGVVWCVCNNVVCVCVTTCVCVCNKVTCYTTIDASPAMPNTTHAQVTSLYRASLQKLLDLSHVSHKAARKADRARARNAMVAALKELL